MRYAGFWVRLVASLIDTLVIALPLGIVVYVLSDGAWMDLGASLEAIRMASSGNTAALHVRPQNDMTWELIFELLMAAVIILFWRRWAGATPGKKMMGIEVVSLDGTPLGNRQLLTRYIGYIVSTLPLLAGFVMVAFRKDKRALHDLLSGTAVCYVARSDQAVPL
ncbi:MAG: RDD family protein [Campylobacterales bacterium]|nr:RDD family protein [Campylobacterales bacterium]